MSLPNYLSAGEYSRQSGLYVEEVKRMCRTGDIKCLRTEKGYYKIPVYDDAVPKEQYQKVKDENTKLKTILSTIVTTASQI